MPTDSCEAVAVFWARCSAPQVLGFVVGVFLMLVSLLIGWWPLAVPGSVVWVAGAFVGTPTASKIRIVEDDWRNDGWKDDLLAALLLREE